MAELKAEYQGFIAWYSLTTHHKRDRGDPTVSYSLKESHKRNTLTVQELWDMAEHYDFNPKNFEIFKSNTCHTVKRLGNKGFIDEIVNKEYIEIYWNNKNRLCACYL